MISDTLRQKFLYSTPFMDDEFPLVALDDTQDKTSICETLSGKELYFWEKDSFDSFINSRKGKVDKIIIVNDCGLKNQNKRLNDGLKCYLMSFAYQFKKAGFLCSIK